MADQKASKKTKRAQRTQKKGAVRQHNPKPVDKMANTGLLDHLSATARHEKNLRSAITMLVSEIGERVAKLAAQGSWEQTNRTGARDYILFLVDGTGTAPVDLDESIMKSIELIFVELCSRRIVGDDVLPGQRQDWYQPTLAKYREERLQATRKPSPLSMPKRRELQAAS